MPPVEPLLPSWAAEVRMIVEDKLASPRALSARPRGRLPEEPIGRAVHVAPGGRLAPLSLGHRADPRRGGHLPGLVGGRPHPSSRGTRRRAGLWCRRSPAVKYALGDLDRFDTAIHLTGYVNSAPGFSNQPRVINGATDLLVELYGDRGKPTRAAIGCHGLALNSSVELVLVHQLHRHRRPPAPGPGPLGPVSRRSRRSGASRGRPSWRPGPAALAPARAAPRAGGRRPRTRQV